MNKASAEGWKDQRDKVESKARAKAEQKVIDAAADNAVLAQEVQRKLLVRLNRTIDKFPVDATEVRQQKDGKTLVFRLRDLTSAYKDMTEDIPRGNAADIEDLNPLVELLQ